MSNRTRDYDLRARRRRAARQKRLRNRKIKRCVLGISGAAFFILLICFLVSFLGQKKTKETISRQKILPKITIDTRLLKKNEYSRPGSPVGNIKGIVVHYTANPGTNAEENRNYFNNLPKLNQGRKSPIYASSHFVIGLEGQIVQCIPLNEIAYASNDRNKDTISIECCHPDESGKFNTLTYKALIELVSYLCIRYDLDEEDVIRHYDVTGKLCPLYFVEHEDEWNELKKAVAAKLQAG